MKRSDTLGSIASALANFQGEVTNPKNVATNDFYKNSKYAPLDEVLNVVRPILAKNGLSVYQEPSTADENHIKLTTLLMHKSGEWIETEPLIFESVQKRKDGGKEINAQGAGSSITYARRYQLCAVLGISSEDDDDGNAASGKTQEQYQGNSQKQQELVDKAKEHNDKPQTNKKEPIKHYCANCASRGVTREIPLDVAQDSMTKYKMKLCRNCQAILEKSKAQQEQEQQQ